MLEPLLAVLLWGGIFVVAKLAMREIPPDVFAVLRVAVASLVLGIGWIGFRFASSPNFPWRSLMFAGLAQTAFQGTFMQSIHLTSAGLSAILLATSPLLSAAWLALRGTEQQSRIQWVGLLLGFGGVALVMGTHGERGGASMLGNLLALAAGAAWAWYGVALRPLVGSIGAIRAASASLLVAGVLLAPIAVVGGATVRWDAVSPGAWAGLAYGGILGLAIPTALWVRGVGKYGTQPTMNYGYVEPVVAVVLAAVFLGETLGPLQITGSLLALTGVFLATQPRPAPRVAPELGA